MPVLALCGLAAAAWYSVRLARADVSYRESNLRGLQEAVRLDPGNAYYHAMLGEFLEEFGANPDAELEIAAKLSPRESRYWIRLAYRAEVERRYDQAEGYLTEAYKLDRGFDPRWALMNYYFRRGKWPEFRKAAREALEMGYGNLDPIFRLCLAASDDPEVTRRILPPRREVLFGFFTYLIKNQYVKAAAPIAVELAKTATPDDVPALVDYCDKQMGQQQGAGLTVWNALCHRHLLPFGELAPDAGRIVTDSTFTALPLQRGFDWRPGSGNGIAVGPLDEAQGVLVDITGRQGDMESIMEQDMPVASGKSYLLTYEYRLVSSRPDSGLQWVVRDVKSEEGAEPIAASPIFTAKDWTSGQFRFPAAQRDAVNLTLRYRRLPGTLKWKGTVQLRSLTSSLAGQASPETARDLTAGQPQPGAAAQSLPPQVPQSAR